MRLILLASLLHWKDQLPVDGMPVNSQMVKRQGSSILPIKHYVRLTLQENGELLQEVETTMVSSS